MADPELWLQRIHPDDRARVMSDEGDAKKTGLLDNEYRFLHADGHIVWVRDQARWVVDATTARACFEGVFADVTERKQAELELTHTAQHDPLTGLVNRRQFTRRARAASSRGGGSASCAVLFVDIDRFKLVNDGHGHEAGDSLLREAGRRLQAALREGDVLSRFGGDEFTAYLPRLRRRLLPRSWRGACWPRSREPFPVARGEVYVGGSVGIAVTGGDSETATDLIRDADVAMYAAKQGGRGRLAALRHEPARGLGAPRRDRQRAPPRARARGDRAAPAADRRPRRRPPGRRRGAAALAARRRSSCRRSSSCRWPRRPG